MTNNKMVEAEAWLTLKPVWSTYNRTDEPNGLRISGIRKSRPRGAEPCVKIKLRMPARAFAPLAPTVTIEVPEDALCWPEPEITVSEVER